PAETWCRSSGRLEDVNPNHSSPIPTMGEVLRIATGHEPDQRGHWGAFGGRYVPEALMAVVDEVTDAYDKARLDEEYLARLDRLQRDYSGRPSPLYEATRFGDEIGARVFLKREDLNHTGSHKINNVLGQALLAQRMGKTRVIAETGAGQHGVATAPAGGRRPARRGPGGGGGPVGARVQGLHGGGRRPPSGSQRGADAAPRRGGRGRGDRLGHAQGRDQRDDARLGGAGGRHVLRVRDRG